MQVRELSIPGAWELTPIQRSDDRGLFLEWYRFDVLQEAVGHALELKQANASISRRGVVRGIHFADVPPGQAKYITTTRGAVMDYVIDIRVGSPTFGQWDSVMLDDVDRRAVYIAEGLGHAFIALTQDATVNYLVSDTYNPTREHGINPLDPDIALVFPDAAGIPLLSPKDELAPSFAEARELGLLPDWHQVRQHYAALGSTTNSTTKG